MPHRCKYRLSDKVTVGGALNAGPGFFDDDNHGTTIEFPGSPPASSEMIYDDAPEAERLLPNPNFGAYFELSINKTDTDGDGIIDMNADGVDSAILFIKKKNKDGSDMTSARDNDAFFVSLDNGQVDKSQGTLSSGTESVNIQPATAKGRTVNILVHGSQESGLKVGRITLKYR